MFRIATWNMDHWKRTAQVRSSAWTYLADQVRPDVALVQEAVPPSDLVSIYHEIGVGRHFGSAVVSYGTPMSEVRTAVTRYSASRAFDLHQTFPGSVAIAEVRPQNSDPITVISLYGLIDVYAQTTVLQQVADLIPLFDTGKDDEMRIVLAGDLNLHTQARASVERRRAAGIIGAIESLGLVNLFELTKDDRPPYPNCRCADSGHCYHVETHRHASLRDDRMGGHNDYIFASPALAVKGRVDLELFHGSEAWGLSDHCPIVASFDLRRTTPLPDDGIEVTAVEVVPDDWADLRAPRIVRGRLTTRQVEGLDFTHTSVDGVPVDPVTINPTNSPEHTS